MKALFIFLFGIFPQVIATGHRGMSPVAWTFVQNQANFSCSAASTTCTISGLTSTTANSILVASVVIVNASAQHITSASGGGGTWSLCPASSCVALNSSFIPALSIDMAYNITGTGGATTATVTISALSTSSWVAEISEWKRSTGTATFDVVNSAPSTSSGCTACTASSYPTLHSPTDLLVQYIVFNGSSPSSVSSPYQVATQGDTIYALGTGSTTAPVVNISPSTAFTSTAISFY